MLLSLWPDRWNSRYSRSQPAMWKSCKDRECRAWLRVSVTVHVPYGGFPLCEETSWPQRLLQRGYWSGTAWEFRGLVRYISQWGTWWPAGRQGVGEEAETSTFRSAGGRKRTEPLGLAAVLRPQSPLPHWQTLSNRAASTPTGPHLLTVPSPVGLRGHFNSSHHKD